MKMRASPTSADSLWLICWIFISIMFRLKMHAFHFIVIIIVSLVGVLIAIDFVDFMIF